VLMWLVGGGVVFSGLIGSYVARISWSDHRSSRGVMLRDTAEILRQDRANYYRFGVRDPEDGGTGYFASPSHRGEIGWMLRHGAIERNLENEIQRGTPLVRVDIYDGHVDVHRTEEVYFPKRAEQRKQTPTVRTLGDDAMIQVRTYAGHEPMGFAGRNLEHSTVGEYYCQEGDREIAWAVIATAPRHNYTCHACAPVLSYCLYAKTPDGGWKRTISVMAAEKVGAWGSPPNTDEMALVHISSGHCALAMRTYYVNMGWGRGNYSLTAIEGGHARTLLSIPASAEDSGVDGTPHTDWTTTLRIKPGSERYHEIHLHRHGLADNRPIDYHVVYHYVGQHFVPDRDDPVAKAY